MSINCSPKDHATGPVLGYASDWDGNRLTHRRLGSTHQNIVLRPFAVLIKQLVSPSIVACDARPPEGLETTLLDGERHSKRRYCSPNSANTADLSTALSHQPNLLREPTNRVPKFQATQSILLAVAEVQAWLNGLQSMKQTSQNRHRQIPLRILEE